MLALAGDAVFAEAEKRKVIFRQPFEKRHRLPQMLARQVGRIFQQLADDRHHLVAHGAPVGDRGAHVIEHARQIVFEPGQNIGRGLLVDLEMHVRFDDRTVACRHRQALCRSAIAALHPQDRMDHEMHGQPGPIEFSGHGIDEERHVVVDDLDDRVRRLPAMLVEARIDDAYLRRAGRTLASELPERHRRAV